MFDHLVQRHSARTVLAPEGVIARNPSPYYTYEVGVDEAPHPDADVAARFVEICVGDCEYECRVYADPYSEIRALVHSQFYGCRRTVADINDRLEGDIHVGDTVSFASRSDPLIKYTGRVLNYLPPDDAGFQGGYHVGCYYIVQPDQVDQHGAAETHQQVYERLALDGIFNEEQVASYLGVSIEAFRKMRLRTTENLIFEGTEFEVNDIVSFYDLEDPSIKHIGKILRYLPANYDPDTYPYGGYIVLYSDERVRRQILFYQKNKLKKEN